MSSINSNIFHPFIWIIMTFTRTPMIFMRFAFLLLLAYASTIARMLTQLDFYPHFNLFSKFLIEISNPSSIYSHLSGLSRCMDLRNHQSMFIFNFILVVYLSQTVFVSSNVIKSFWRYLNIEFSSNVGRSVLFHSFSISIQDSFLSRIFFCLFANFVGKYSCFWLSLQHKDLG